MSIKHRGVMFMIWGVLLLVFQLTRPVSPGRSGTAGYLWLTFGLPAAVFALGLYRYRSAARQAPPR